MLRIATTGKVGGRGSGKVGGKGRGKGARSTGTERHGAAMGVHAMYYLDKLENTEGAREKLNSAFGADSTRGVDFNRMGYEDMPAAMIHGSGF